MNAMIAAVGRSAANRLATYLRDRAARAAAERRRRRHIAEFDHLLRLDDRLIADVGLTREEICARRTALLHRPQHTWPADFRETSLPYL